MKHRAPQIDLPLPDEPFTLAVQTGVDADRITREQHQAQADKASAETRQTAFELLPTLFLTITGSDCDPNERLIPFRTLNEASAIYRRLIDQNCFGASQVGQAIITDGKTAVAHISYNGKVWQGKDLRGRSRSTI